MTTYAQLTYNAVAKCNTNVKEGIISILVWNPHTSTHIYYILLFIYNR